ncbi:MAG: hypothetical protein RBU37_06505 [Myxococcota bacterium]|nr:hypothetical protein [Myxococcota bacterium]
MSEKTSAPATSEGVNSNSPAESTTQPRQTKGGTLAPTLSPAAAAPTTPEPEED